MATEFANVVAVDSAMIYHDSKEAVAPEEAHVLVVQVHGHVNPVVFIQAAFGGEDVNMWIVLKIIPSGLD